MEYFLTFMVMSFLLLGVLLWYVIHTKSTSYNFSKRRVFKLTVKEAVIIAIASFFLPSFVVGFVMLSQTADTEILNGKVTHKERDEVSCRHSYSCNCRESCTGSGQNRSCSTTCDTCYEHSYDVDWDVHTTIGTFNIVTIDRQGLREPPRWTQVKTNDPVSRTHTFINLIKSARYNVLNKQDTQITYPMPEYPSSIYDYYKVDRAISIDYAMSHLNVWSFEISKALNDLGNAKQVNLVIVFTKNPEIYADQLNASWLGGKKNDVIVVIGTTDRSTPDWVKVLSWSKNEDFKIGIRELLIDTELKPVETVKVIADEITKGFSRRQMEEFDYLKYDLDPPDWVVLLAFLSFFVPLGGYVFSCYRH